MGSDQPSAGQVQAEADLNVAMRRIALLEEQVTSLRRHLGAEDPELLEAEKRSIAERLAALEDFAETLARRGNRR